MSNFSRLNYGSDFKTTYLKVESHFINSEREIWGQCHSPTNPPFFFESEREFWNELGNFIQNMKHALSALQLAMSASRAGGPDHRKKRLQRDLPLFHSVKTQLQGTMQESVPSTDTRATSTHLSPQPLGSWKVNFCIIYSTLPHSSVKDTDIYTSYNCVIGPVLTQGKTR